MIKCYINLLTTFEAKRHALAPKAHHLQVLGSAVQGKGYGSKIIQIGIDRAEKAGVDCYLESSNVKNIPFYKRHGFQILEQVYPFEDKNTGEKGPVATLMLRPSKKKK
jgi:ribosomal protein S18 acetylase RimI-like enzyme